MIDLVSESEAALAMTPADEAAYRKLVAETGALLERDIISNITSF